MLLYFLVHCSTRYIPNATPDFASAKSPNPKHAMDTPRAQYSVEYAKSGRAACRAAKGVCEVLHGTDRKIAKGALRLVMTMPMHDKMISTFRHLECVPDKKLAEIAMRTDGDISLLEGFGSLTPQDQQAFVERVAAAAAALEEAKRERPEEEGEAAAPKKKRARGAAAKKRAPAAEAPAGDDAAVDAAVE
ncbi:MAG: hypothetical protein J3K34DRAFT_402901 [Monoraphidium minutum]|nr:MAG: hypothetical protein J3K34DRAFT_402901 [Monoraphidium minutum]